MTIEIQAGGVGVDPLGVLAAGSSSDPWDDAKTWRAGETGIDPDGFEGGSGLDPIGDPRADGGVGLDPLGADGGSAIDPVGART